MLLPMLALLAQAAGAAPPRAYSLEERLFWTAGTGPASLVRIHVSGDRIRLETYVSDALTRTTIVRPDRGLAYLLDDRRKTYRETRLAAFREKGGVPYQTLAGYQEEATRGVLTLKKVAQEKIRGETCDKYAITYTRTESSFRFWVSTTTGLPVLWVPEGETEGPDAESRVEWTNLKVGPQPDALFEVPAGYRKEAATP